MRSLLRTMPRIPVVIVGMASLLLLVNNVLPDNSAIDTELVATVLCFAIGATAIVASFAEKIGPRRVLVAARHGIIGSLVAVTSLTISLVAAEYLLRWVYRDVTTTSDDRGFFSRRWALKGAGAFNSLGFREREFSEQKSPGTFRIAVVGDSFTYANGLDAEYRFSALIQQEVGPGVEVLNFGVPGNNTPQHAETLRRNVLRVEPDFILMQWFINDVEGHDTIGRPTYQPLLPPPLHEWMYRSSALYTLLNMRWTQFQAESSVGTYEEYIKARFGDPTGQGAKADREAMLEIAALCRNAHVKFGFVLFPDSGFDLGEGYPFAFLHERELAFCAEQQITCVDLRPAMTQITDRQKLWVNRLDHHPSARANQIAAIEILRAFAAEWATSRDPS